MSSYEQKAKQLFDATYQLENELILLKNDLKQLKEDNSYHKDDNPQGMDKELVSKIMKAAKHKAAQDNLQDKIDELEEITQIQDKYS